VRFNSWLSAAAAAGALAGKIGKSGKATAADGRIYECGVPAAQSAV